MGPTFKTLKIYSYRCAMGTFVIFPEQPGCWLLTLDTELIGHYDFAEKAAEAVARHSIGLARWDHCLDAVPSRLSSWQHQRLVVAAAAPLASAALPA